MMRQWNAPVLRLWIRLLLLAVVIFAATTVTTATQLTNPMNVSVGDMICYEGFIMDQYCIDRGTLLDDNDIVTLEQPDQHSVHCLIDVPACRKSSYEILGDPVVAGGLYTRAFRVDDMGKAGLQALAARTGASNPGGGTYRCAMCTGDGTLARGFRAQVYGQVIALSTQPDGSGGVPHTIKVLDAMASHNMPKADICSNQVFPTQNPEFAGTKNSSSSSNDDDTLEKVFMALALIAVAGVGVISLFGNKLFIFRGTTATTTTTTPTGDADAAPLTAAAFTNQNKV